MKTATAIMMRALASTAFFHTGSSLMSGICTGPSGSSSSLVGEELPPWPKNRLISWQIPDCSSSSATEREKEFVICFSGCLFCFSPSLRFPFVSYLHRFYSPSSSCWPLSWPSSLFPLAPSPDLFSPLWNDEG